MNKARERYEEETKDMTLQEKLVWVNERIFWIAIDDSIQDWDSYHEYHNIKRELEEQLNKEL